MDVEVASSPGGGEVPLSAPVLPASMAATSLLQQHQQQQESMRRVGSVTQRMLSNPEPSVSAAAAASASAGVSPLPTDASPVSSSSQGKSYNGDCLFAVMCGK